MAYDFWSTRKLGAVTDFTRHRVIEAREHFANMQTEDRRRGLSTWDADERELHCRRAEDRLDALRAELIRRALESLTERRIGKRKGAQHRREPDWLPVPIAGRAVVVLE